MWPAKKKKIVDLTKPSYLNKFPKPEIDRSVGKDGYKDLSFSDSSSVNSEESALGFLGDFASSSQPSAESASDLHTKHLKVKIEDIEYKLDSLSRKLSNVLDRLDLAEKKLARNKEIV